MDTNIEKTRGKIQIKQKNRKRITHIFLSKMVYKLKCKSIQQTKHKVVETFFVELVILTQKNIPVNENLFLVIICDTNLQYFKHFRILFIVI